MRKTEHYQLNLWDAEDAILRTDFNADNEKIEAALADIVSNGVKMAYGTYEGTGEDYEGVTLNVGFNPKLLIVWKDINHRLFYLEGMTSVQTYTNFADDYTRSANITVENGVVSWDSYNTAHILLNDSATYRWFAIG